MSSPSSSSSTGTHHCPVFSWTTLAGDVQRPEGAEAVGPDDLVLVAGGDERLVGVGTRVAAGSRRREGAPADVELHGWGPGCWRRCARPARCGPSPGRRSRCRLARGARDPRPGRSRGRRTARASPPSPWRRPSRARRRLPAGAGRCRARPARPPRSPASGPGGRGRRRRRRGRAGRAPPDRRRGDLDEARVEPQRHERPVGHPERGPAAGAGGSRGRPGGRRPSAGGACARTRPRRAPGRRRPRRARARRPPVRAVARPAPEPGSARRPRRWRRSRRVTGRRARRRPAARSRPAAPPWGRAARWTASSGRSRRRAPQWWPVEQCERQRHPQERRRPPAPGRAAHCGVPAPEAGRNTRPRRAAS